MSVSSPCKSECRLTDEVCEGCGRTRREIAGWSKMTEQQREDVIKRLGERD